MQTVMFSHIIRLLGARTLVLVNRAELVEQTVATLKRVLPTKVYPLGVRWLLS
jgi:superfamily II DNA or RNA helicase